jgi:singapore isolate B (sub-type 7) whole genome shotgun sequence assembly, scaffold_0
MNTFTIEFKGPKDLAKKIAEYNELMNPKSIEELAVNVVEEPKQEVKPEPKKETTPKVVEEPKEEPVELVEPVEEVAEVPVTNFEGKPVEVKAEEVEEPSETELDVDTAEIDPQVYWNDFKDWLKHVGAEGVKAALDVFRNHGVNGKPNSGDLTPEIMQELNALMGK